MRDWTKHNTELFRFIVLSECVSVSTNVVSNVCLSLSFGSGVACVCFKCHISKGIVCYLLRRHSHTSDFTPLTVGNVYGRCLYYLRAHTRNFGSMHNTTMNANELQCARLTTVNSFTLQWNAFSSKEKQTANIHFLFIKFKQNSVHSMCAADVCSAHQLKKKIKAVAEQQRENRVCHRLQKPTTKNNEFHFLFRSATREMMIRALFFRRLCLSNFRSDGVWVWQCFLEVVSYDTRVSVVNVHASKVLCVKHESR